MASKTDTLNKASNWPIRLNKREAKVVETAEKYSPATPANWASAPDNQDDALDNLAAALGGFQIVNAQLHTTVGGAAAEDVSISGVLATDVVLAVVADDGTNDTTIVSAAAGADKVTITYSADPGDDAVTNIVVIRP